MLATFADMLNLPITKKRTKKTAVVVHLYSHKSKLLYNREYIMTQNNGGEIAIRKREMEIFTAKKE